MDTVTPKRILWIASTAAFLYIGAFYWVVTNFDIPTVGPYAVLLIVVGGVVQISAKLFFGLLFRESIRRAGGDIAVWSAFKAALVGAGVARMIPAGGAITPVAMAWTVRDEVEGSAGAAIRTVLLNYAGLLIMTGAGLLLARPRESAQFLSISLIVLAPFVLGAGVLLMFGSGKLGTLLRLLPERLRGKLEASMVNHTPALQSQAFIWGRLLAEAGALAFILAAYGFPVTTTLAPVLVFRVISYWLPAALGFLAGGSTFLGSEAARRAEAVD